MQAAFRGNTVGFSKFVPDENIAKVTKEEIFAYMSQHHAPKRIVIAGKDLDLCIFVSLQVDTLVEASLILYLYGS